MVKKMISFTLYSELKNILVCAQFSLKKARVPKVYALSRSYLECLGYFRFFSNLMPNP